MGEKRRRAQYMAALDRVSLNTSLPGNGYKFFNKNIESAIFERGSIKITSLSECRSYEDPTLGDDLEGTRSTFAPGIQNGLQLKLGDSLSPFGSIFGPASPSVDLSTIYMGGFGVREILPDYFLYCYSTECNQSVAASFRYDSVAEILNVEVLARHILSCKRLAGYRCIISDVNYRDRARNVTEYTPSILQSVFEKPPRFKANREARILFLPTTGEKESDLRHFIIEDSRITRLFVRHPFPTCTAGEEGP